MKPIRYILLILLTLNAPPVLFAQEATSVSIKASATVIDMAEIELFTIKDMHIDESMAIDGKIYVSAQRDTEAAVMMVLGRPEAHFRVSFIPVIEIVNSRGSGSLLFHYEMNGYPSDNQSASERLDAPERVFRLSRTGQFYFWVGGRIDISNARPGSYDGEFTIEIEYI